MKNIERYTFLNLHNRADRRLLSACSAVRDGIPADLIHFWIGDTFETCDDLGRYAVEEHGLEKFRGHIGRKEKVPPIVLQNFSIICYLTDRIKRKDSLEVFLHDDVYFVPPLTPKFHQNFNSLCRLVQGAGEEINLMLLDPTYDGIKATGGQPEPDLLEDTYIMLKGIRGGCDYARVYSAKGAQFILDRILELSVSYLPESIFADGWSPPGSFTTSVPVVSRYPRGFVASNVCPDNTPLHLFKTNKGDMSSSISLDL